MKRILLALLLILLIITLSACSDDDRFPYVNVQTGVFRWDVVRIDIGNEYSFMDFNKEYSNDGVVVSMRFMKSE